MVGVKITPATDCRTLYALRSAEGTKLGAQGEDNFLDFVAGA